MGNKLARLGGFIRRTTVLQPQGNGASFLCSDTQANSPKKDAPSPCYPNADLMPERGLFNRRAMVLQPTLFGLIFVVLLAACGGGGGEAQERLVDIHYGATPASSDASTFVCGQRLSVLPGEKIRFRVYNHTNDDLEFIVTDEEGADLRRQELQPGLRIIPASLSATGTAGFSGSGEMAHAGHDEEIWPDATEDYRYRFIVDPAFGDRPNVRNELVTFPDATEDYVLSRYICAHPDILEERTISSISRR